MKVPQPKKVNSKPFTYFHNLSEQEVEDMLKDMEKGQVLKENIPKKEQT